MATINIALEVTTKEAWAIDSVLDQVMYEEMGESEVRSEGKVLLERHGISYDRAAVLVEAVVSGWKAAQ